MNRLFTISLLSILLSGTQLFADAGFQSLEKLQDASCKLFQVYRSNPYVFRPDIIIYFDGLLNGATVGNVPTAFFTEEFESICSADPDTKLEAALNAAREAVLKRMQ